MFNSNALAEVYFVLCNLNKDEYNKIPANIIKVIKENMNMEYRFDINKDTNIINQPFLVETKAILFSLFKNYLATSNQKERIVKIECKEREEFEAYKRQKYNTDNIFN